MLLERMVSVVGRDWAQNKGERERKSCLNFHFVPDSSEGNQRKSVQPQFLGDADAKANGNDTFSKALSIDGRQGGGMAQR